ncbi:MAG: galactokinase [Candidatus Aminicenantes bacterium]|nr:galactokinase [Candidatus Aminicenantes bacterium]
MTLTRTPFRITLGGGGTDLPAYYSRFGGFVFAAGIDKYMFINVRRPETNNLVRVQYEKTETVVHRDKLKHDLAREALRMLGIENNIDIVSKADIPPGTGLGSSSCYAVGILNALHAFRKESFTPQELAEEACRLEIDILNKPIGKQDQYMAVFGGLTVLEIEKNGKVNIRKADISKSTAEDLSKNLQVFYTNIKRDSNQILSEQSLFIRTNKNSVVDKMHHIKEMGYNILHAAEGGNLTDIGLLMDQHWEYKRKISSKMSNSGLDEIYEIAKENGALGGKIMGAGGGGFFVFYIERRFEEFRRILENLGLKRMDYQFDHEGTMVLDKQKKL